MKNRATPGIYQLLSMTVKREPVHKRSILSVDLLCPKPYEGNGLSI